MLKLTIGSVMLSILWFGRPASMPAQDRVDPTELLARVRLAYEHSTTYADVVLAERYRGRDTIPLETCVVRTDFVRSRGMRLESKCKRFTSLQVHHIVLESKGKTQTAEVGPNGTG